MKITNINTYLVRPRWGFVEVIIDEVDGGASPSPTETFSDSFEELARALQKLVPNRQYLPEGASLRYVRETDASGKTVAGRIDLVFHRGAVIIFR